MSQPRTDAAQARSIMVGITVALLVMAVALVVVAMITQTWLLLTGLIGLGAGGAAAYYAMHVQREQQQRH